MEILIDGVLDYCEVKEWKRRYFVMKYEISSALRYIEIYKDKNWRKQLPRHVVNLHPGYDVKRKEDPKKKYCFTVKTTDHCLLLASDDENIVNQWMATLEEYNLVKSFCVQPQDTPTMIRIEAIYPCHLQLVHSEVRLVSAMDGKLLGLWPFKCIRRYKFFGNVFCIEAGRKAPTGEGLFEFISNECSEIYRVMDTIIRTTAGNTTMRRLASEKIQHQVAERQPVRKTKSVPSPSNLTAELQYDYAVPEGDFPAHTQMKLSFPELPSPPTQFSSGRGGSEPDDTYDILSPGEQCAHDFESRFCEQQEKSNEDGPYNTLQFKKPSLVESSVHNSHKTLTMDGSGSSYDTLQFEEHPSLAKSSSEKTLPGKTSSAFGSYDKLQFSSRPAAPPRRNLSSSSLDDIASTADQVDGPSPEGGMYDTLNRLTVSQPSVDTQQNTYDRLGDSQTVSQQADTYDCLGETKPDRGLPITLDVGHTYDQLHDTQKTATRGKTSPSPELDISPEKPVALKRPPPRKKPPKPPEEIVERRKPAGPPPSKPKRLPKPARKNLPAKPEQGSATPSPQTESFRDIIEKKAAKPVDDDDGCYASVDHEYASIDYTKVSRPAENNLSSNVYCEPCDVDGKEAAGSSSKPVRPKRNPPKGVLNLFKKGGESNFADELRKKLECKLKKKNDKTTDSSWTTKPSAPSSHTNNPADVGIYDEVDNTNCPTYCEPDIDPSERNV